MNAYIPKNGIIWIHFTIPFSSRSLSFAITNPFWLSWLLKKTKMKCADQTHVNLRKEEYKKAANRCENETNVRSKRINDHINWPSLDEHLFDPTNIFELNSTEMSNWFLFNLIWSIEKNCIVWYIEQYDREYIISYLILWILSNMNCRNTRSFQWAASLWEKLKKKDKRRIVWFPIYSVGTNWMRPLEIAPNLNMYVFVQQHR